MEKYDAILRTINDKIADCEKTIEYYRDEVARKEAIILKLEEKAVQAENDCGKVKARLETLENEYENKLDEISELKAANAKLTARINELEKF